MNKHQNATPRSRRIRNANDGQLVDKWRPDYILVSIFMKYGICVSASTQFADYSYLMRCGEWTHPFQCMCRLVDDMLEWTCAMLAGQNRPESVGQI